MATAAGVTIKALRCYEQTGLFQPARPGQTRDRDELTRQMRAAA